jgi:AcrR family transcriptional regulator
MTPAGIHAFDPPPNRARISPDLRCRSYGRLNVSRSAVRARRSYDREASREAIVAAAMHAFGEHGYAATRVEDIVEAAGYTRGAFYFHFENKLECFWAVVEQRERQRGDWVAAVTAGVDAGTVALEQLLQRVFGHFAATNDGVTAWVLVMVDFFQQHRDDPAAHARIAEVYAVWLGGITRFVRVLQEGGWIPAGGDPELLATEIFAYVEGLNTHSRLYGLPADRVRTALIGGLVALLTSEREATA